MRWSRKISGWQERKGRFAHHAAEAAAIIGQVVFRRPADYDEDYMRNTDLLTGADGVLKVSGYRVSLRIRSYAALEKYRDQFTIRTTYRGDTPTELDKIVDKGLGDLMLYGFADVDDEGLEAWRVIDLRSFADAYAVGEIEPELVQGKGFSFAAFDCNQLPQGVCIASSRDQGWTRSSCWKVSNGT